VPVVAVLAVFAYAVTQIQSCLRQTTDSCCASAVLRATSPVYYCLQCLLSLARSGQRSSGSVLSRVNPCSIRIWLVEWAAWLCQGASADCVCRCHQTGIVTAAAATIVAAAWLLDTRVLTDVWCIWRVLRRGHTRGSLAGSAFRGYLEILASRGGAGGRRQSENQPPLWRAATRDIF
jgi:hypothetical protein